MTTSILERLDPRSLGQRLQVSRRRARKTQQDAAEWLDVARTTITAIEKGERRLQPRELVRLAELYEVHVHELLRPGEPIEGVTVLLRASMPKGLDIAPLLEPHIVEFERLCEDYAALERMRAAPLPRRYPAVYSIDRLEPEAAAEDIATLERHRLGLGDGPVSDIRDMLEGDIGLRVFYLNLPSRVSAWFVFDEVVGGCIAVNRNHPEERRRMSMLHELAHFLTNRNRSEITAFGRYDRIPEHERFADAFARNFLMPASGLRRRFNDVKQHKSKVVLGDFLMLADVFVTSFEALLLRAEELGLIRPGTWDDLKSKGFKAQEARDLLQFSRPVIDDHLLPRRYRYLAAEAYFDGQLTDGQLARFLRTDLISARRMAEQMAEAQYVTEDLGEVREIAVALETVVGDRRE